MDFTAHLGRATQRDAPACVVGAVFTGGAITLYPVGLALTRPGEAITRYTIAAAQMLMGALLIHLSGGRIETHFHVFGSLAFLSFYRDWRVLIPAVVVVVLDHSLRSLYWPYSIFGVLTGSLWRVVEHAGWVIFECVFLTLAITRSVNEMKAVAGHTASGSHQPENRRNGARQPEHDGVFAGRHLLH